MFSLCALTLNQIMDRHESQKICTDCWTKTITFHSFYTNIRNVQDELLANYHQEYSENTYDLDNADTDYTLDRLIKAEYSETSEMHGFQQDNDDDEHLNPAEVKYMFDDIKSDNECGDDDTFGDNTPTEDALDCEIETKLVIKKSGEYLLRIVSAIVESIFFLFYSRQLHLNQNQRKRNVRRCQQRNRCRPKSTIPLVMNKSEISLK